MKSSSKKIPKSAKHKQQPTEKVPRKQLALPVVRGAPISWRFSAVDAAGPFSWAALNDSDAFKAVIDKLRSYETMTEADILNGGSHFIELSSLSKEAAKRLEEIQRDDEDGLYSFRVGAKERVFCRVYEKIMHVLWWDPEHQVCPSNKKHT